MEQEYVWGLIAKKLTGEATAEELLELEFHLRKNPELHYSMQTIIDLWKSQHPLNQEEAHLAFNRHVERMQLMQVDYSLSAEQEFAEMVPSSAGSRTKRIFLWSALSALSIIILYFAGARLIPAKPSAIAKSDKSNSEITTRNGSKTNLVLPDGTEVWLNAGSKLSYDKDFNNSVREVSLMGEAFFDVVKNAEKPFVIHANKINIKVLGTRFNVKSYPSDRTTEATLIRGSIEVTFRDRPTQKIILKPNEKIVVSNEAEAAVDTVYKRKERKYSPVSAVTVGALTYEPTSGAVIETSWVENKFIFQNESFEDLARQMERWYGVTILFKNPKSQELHFTGIFENETIQQALNALKILTNFNYTIEGNTVTILR
jgi:transmembrane sensor